MSDFPWLKQYATGVDWHAEITPQPLYSILDDTVARFPDNIVLDFMDRTTSYRELSAMVDRAARGFQELGVAKGVKVGLFLPNCPQFVVCYFAILKAGGTVVNFSPLYSEEQLLHQIEDSDTDIMVTLHLKLLYPKMDSLLKSSRLRKLIVGTMQEVLPFPKSWLFPLVKHGDIAKVPNDAEHLSFQELLNNDGLYQPVEIDPLEDVAVLQYTGGTTGVAKGAMLTHATVYANAKQVTAWMPDYEPGAERMLGVLPFFHVFSMTVVMNLSINIGARIIVHPRFELDDVIKDIGRKRPTLMPGVPTMYVAIINHPDIAGIDMTSLKACLAGGAPMPVEVKQRFEEMTGATLVEGYGLTETSAVTSANPLSGANKPGSIGLPLPGTEIIIVDREDHTKVMPQGEPGEICVRGPQVMKGYYGREEATAETLIDGMLRTGDVGYLDEDGYTFIIDRMKDLILAGGFNVYPRHVEESVYEHPAVEEVTVIGIPDDYRGQSVKAFIKLKDGQAVSEDELLTFLKAKLGKHEMPSEIEFRPELPKTMVGKLSKKELVAEEQEKYEARKAANP